MVDTRWTEYPHMFRQDSSISGADGQGAAAESTDGRHVRFPRFLTQLLPGNRGLSTIVLLAAMLGCIVLAGSGCGSAGSANNPPPNNAIVVNSLTDTAQPPAGTMTLRAALDQATSGKTITFDSALDGGTIALSIVGESHSVLKGEVYSGMTFDGYADRDYGKSPSPGNACQRTRGR